MQIKFSTRQVHGYLNHGSYHVVVDGWKVGTVRRSTDPYRVGTMWEFCAPDGHATGRTRIGAVEAYYAARQVEAAHRYGDPCATCGEPAYDYNTPKCSTCRRAEERSGTDALSRLYTPGKARLLAEIRAASDTAPEAPQDAAVDTIEPGDTVTAELTIGHGETARVFTITGTVFVDYEGTLRIRDSRVTHWDVNLSRDANGYFPAGVVVRSVAKPYPWAASYEALTTAQDALLGPSVLSVEAEEARENRRAYDEIARDRAGETCLHCGHTVMFVEETECWFGRVSGYDCPDAPAGSYGIRSHDV